MPNNNKKYIGVFDSGFGGINVLRDIINYARY
jgi:glutamate racemase